MASTVAKFAIYNINNEDFLSSRNISESMEEDVVLEQLSDDRFQQRSDILDYLRTEVRKHGGRIQFQNMSALFRGLSRALADSNWTVRHQCVQLISEMIAGLEDELDSCMSTVLPKLVSNIGDSKVALRKAVIQTLHLYMKHSSDVQNVFHAIVEHGLESPDPKVRAETTINFPLLLTAEFAKQDLFTITQALAKRLHGNTENEENKIAIISLERIRSLVGNEVFDGYVQRLSKPTKQVYLQLTEREENGYDGHVDVNLNSSKGVLGSGTPWKHGHSRDIDNVGKNLEFGIIPKHTMDQLLDQNDLRVRAQGIEELREIVNDLPELTPLLPHILAFISFLCNLLDDVNFKVTTVTLDIFGKLVLKLGQGVKPYLKSLMTALTKRLGDNQIVIRQANMKVLMHLMQLLTPKPILNLLTDSLQHRNSRVREEALNVVIASLLTFPSYDFDLGQLCQTIAHTLVDPKRKVRQASLEAFAVLAQAMGPGRLQPLVSAVDSVELSMEGDGVMAAVQARLARRQLPRLNKDGLVEYSIPLPASATTRGSPPSADIEWIMAAAGGGTSSARERTHSEQNRELSQPTSARSSSGHHETIGPTPAPRRYHSAGKNRKKLPWEELPNEDDGVELEKLENSNQRNHPNSAPSHKRPNEDKPPLKARHTWSEVDDNIEIKPFRYPKGSSGSRDQSPDSGSGAGGSYRQIHLTN
ncbi:TOG array regulator of axonemal microtubules protein 1-like [Ptychodera flava]|uniref:TOG array regulator of axonemal microtubules protein 1-like n=1 Tax=Ptychodera flava TaxID=63121 RepID=UPI00396A5E2B